MAGSPDRELGEARNAIDRGDARGALKSLDRARKGYARALDSDGLEHVLDMAALLDASDERVRVGRENLAYAAKQNLRQESRRRARQLGRSRTLGGEATASPGSSTPAARRGSPSARCSRTTTSCPARWGRR